MNLRKGIVVETHPEDNSVDLVMCDDGARLSGVPVLSGSASARSGSTGMPELPKRANKWDITQRHGTDMEAIVGSMGRGNPVVLGFMFPQVSQMTFEDKQRSFSRHQSDVYQTIDSNGNIEVYHPSGAFVRIAESSAHEDLEKKNFDKSLQLDRNKDKKILIHFQASDGGSSGTINHDGTITFKAPTKITCDTPLLEVPNGDVVASGVSLLSHVHTGVEPGGGLSGVPMRKSAAAEVPGSSESKKVTENGVAPANENANIKLKYGEVPSVSEIGRRIVSPIMVPQVPSAISPSLFRERFRFGETTYRDGQQVVAVSKYNPATDDFSIDTIDPTLPPVGQYFGEIPFGVLSGSTASAPFDVLSSESGALYASYDQETFGATQWDGPVFCGETVVILKVFFEISQAEFLEHSAPPAP